VLIFFQKYLTSYQKWKKTNKNVVKMVKYLSKMVETAVFSTKNGDYEPI
jgi:Txe/YoeB family toxin of Txe-Axe toxin-antitoxin module